MKYSLIPFFLIIFFIHPSFAGSLPDAPHIVVTGEHEIRATPDILTISLSISETGLEVAEARNSIEKRSKKLIHSLEALEIAKEDISSTQLQITPHYNWNNRAQIYVGTEVSRTFQVTLRDLSHYDDLIRSIIDARVAQILVSHRAVLPRSAMAWRKPESWWPICRNKWALSIRYHLNPQAHLFQRLATKWLKCPEWPNRVHSNRDPYFSRNLSSSFSTW